ncbi:Glycosyltransferase involved in cell wall bisynthesis [Nitrosospira sp. Nsp11]|uniref:glycosyltransferase family 4 protein n=1 Tax=Nitrosospira sp. Nsp11 TaxID=1855338 RepID=UPI00091E4A11|nr:glycosyltransferase family 1 protein [Nitrosospira sp. Nsp11]SHL77335.1 Glycosyltransferase involved in cell wall bisynthesis [Nitrosospira sp. Nsp11]
MVDTKLYVGVYQGPDIPQSFRVYAENVQRYLPGQGVSVIPFIDKRSLPKSVDVLWDIRSGGGNPPPHFLLGNHLPPLVVTVHGFAPVALNGWEYFRTLKGLIMSERYANRKRALWEDAHTAVAGIIAVSAFVKEEAVQFTNVSAEKIYVCHHGVDKEVFTTQPGVEPEGYFFHISNGEPRKNIHRIVRAFRRLRRNHNAQLVLKLPEHSARQYEGIDGVRVITGFLKADELADLYCRALAFIFPSLYEGFGIPIIEAMACGCPVITSDTSACPEVAGEAGLTVDPRDENALLEAMLAFCHDMKNRPERVASGLRRGEDFSWSKSAQCHVGVLRKTAQIGCRIDES